MTELFSWRRATRRGPSLIIEADVTDVDRMVRARAALLGFAVTKDEHVDATMAALTARAEAAIARMQRDGSMKRLNREYAASSATSRPPYAEWLTERLRTEVPRFADLATVLARQPAA